METKVCPKCQKEINAQTAFCTFCGAAQTARTAPPEPTPQQWPRQEPPKQTPPAYTPPMQQVPPMYQTPPVSQPYYSEEGSGMGWIVFLRVILWIIFGAIILTSLIQGIMMMDWGDEGAGIATILGGILAAFLIVAGGMVSLNNASNHRKIANNTAKILQILQQQNRK